MSRNKRNRQTPLSQQQEQDQYLELRFPDEDHVFEFEPEIRDQDQDLHNTELERSQDPTVHLGLEITECNVENC